MDRKPLLWIVAVIVALVAGWQLAPAQVEKEKEAQKWEYKVSQESLNQDRLNDMGKGGWELVCIDRYSSGNDPILCFKRPK